MYTVIWHSYTCTDCSTNPCTNSSDRITNGADSCTDIGLVRRLRRWCMVPCHKRCANNDVLWSDF